MRRRIFAILHEGDGRVGQWASTAIAALIILNAVALVVGSEPALDPRVHRWLDVFEVFSLLTFTIEYILRLWSIVELPRFAHPIAGRLRYARSPGALIDLLAILPGLLPIAELDLRSLRLIRLLRMLRLFRLRRQAHTLNTLLVVVRARQGELAMVLGVVTILLVVFSTLIWHAGNEAQPERFPSIGASFWWSIITMTTIGYGDTFPITTMGKIIGGAAALLGVGLVTLPAGILAAGFIEELRARSAPRICPHCGNPVSDDGVRLESGRHETAQAVDEVHGLGDQHIR